MYPADLTLLRIAGDLVVRPPIAGAAYSCIAAKRKKIARACLLGQYPHEKPMNRHPPSPCNSICKIDPASGRCLGCKRTLEEIADWPMLRAAQKRAVLERLEGR